MVREDPKLQKKGTVNFRQDVKDHIYGQSTRLITPTGRATIRVACGLWLAQLRPLGFDLFNERDTEQHMSKLYLARFYGIVLLIRNSTRCIPQGLSRSPVLLYSGCEDGGDLVLPNIPPHNLGFR